MGPESSGPHPQRSAVRARQPRAARSAQLRLTAGVPLPQARSDLLPLPPEPAPPRPPGHSSRADGRLGRAARPRPRSVPAAVPLPATPPRQQRPAECPDAAEAAVCFHSG